jgi:hypothetical protein
MRAMAFEPHLYSFLRPGYRYHSVHFLSHEQLREIRQVHLGQLPTNAECRHRQGDRNFYASLIIFLQR